MARLLYVKTSPRHERAYSTRAADAFIEDYRAANPDDEIEELDLWRNELPRFDGEILAAKYAKLRRMDFTPEQDAAWAAVQAVIDHFRGFDKMVFAIPMWNFTVPYVLKHYIDIIVQPGVTYGVDSEGKLRGFVEGKKALCICASGSPYDGDAPLAPGDFLRPYLQWIFKWIGIEDLRIEMIAPTTKGDELATQALERATAACRKLAKEF